MEESVMAAIKLTDQTLRYITFFENLTNTRVKDCLERFGTIYFIVDKGQFHKAIGRNGLKIKHLRGSLHKNVKIIEYSPHIETFIRNIFREFSIKEITIENSSDGKNKIANVVVNLSDKGKIIGLDSKNLKIAKEIVNRHEKIDILII